MQIAHRVGEAGFVQHNNKDCVYGTLKLLQGSEMKIQESKSYVLNSWTEPRDSLLQVLISAK